MMTPRFFTVAVACLAIHAFYTVAAEAQQQSVASRGTVKVRSRLLNPFDVSTSQLTVDRFGRVSFQPQARPALMANAPIWASAAVFSVALAPAAPAAVSTSTAAASALPAAGAGGDAIAIGSAVRPPYRPPVRSPFRPPPRPPF